MLLIFNFDWKAFSIDSQVSKHNKRLKDLAGLEGVGHKITFNCASMGAGEHILGPGAGRDHSVRPITPITLDSLRRFHSLAKSELQRDAVFSANRDLSESLIALRRDGHILAAVWAEATSELEKLLEMSRTRDYFEDEVFGYDRRDKYRQDDLTYLGLYRTVVREERADPSETVVVSDTPEGIQEAKGAKSRAVVGYVPPFAENRGAKLKEMEVAGADYALTRATDLAMMPWRITGQAQNSKGFDPL